MFLQRGLVGTTTNSTEHSGQVTSATTTWDYTSGRLQQLMYVVIVVVVVELAVAVAVEQEDFARRDGQAELIWVA